MKKGKKNYFNDMRIVGQELKKRRLALKMSLDEVADKIGLQNQTIISYESGRRVPHDEIKCKLCNVYGCTVQDVFFTKKSNLISE